MNTYTVFRIAWLTVILATPSFAQTYDIFVDSGDITCTSSGKTMIIRGNFVAKCDDTVCDLDDHAFNLDTYAATGSTCSNHTGDFDDAVVIMQYFFFNGGNRAAYAIGGQTMGLFSTFNFATQTVTLDPWVGVRYAGDAYISIHFQVIATTNDESRIVRQSSTCTVSTHGCAQTPYSASALPTGWSLLGTSITGFSMDARVGGSGGSFPLVTSIAVGTNAIEYPTSSGGILGSTVCMLTGKSSGGSPVDYLSCGIAFVALVGNPSALSALQTTGTTPSYPIYYDIGQYATGWNVSASGTPRGFSCGLKNFSMSLDSSAGSTLYAIAAGARGWRSSDVPCGSQPTPNWEGTYVVALQNAWPNNYLNTDFIGSTAILGIVQY